MADNNNSKIKATPKRVKNFKNVQIGDIVDDSSMYKITDSPSLARKTGKFINSLPNQLKNDDVVKKIKKFSDKQISYEDKDYKTIRYDYEKGLKKHEEYKKDVRSKHLENAKDKLIKEEYKYTKPVGKSVNQFATFTAAINDAKEEIAENEVSRYNSQMAKRRKEEANRRKELATILLVKNKYQKNEKGRVVVDKAAMAQDVVNFYKGMKQHDGINRFVPVNAALSTVEKLGEIGVGVGKAGVGVAKFAISDKNTKKAMVANLRDNIRSSVNNSIEYAGKSIADIPKRVDYAVTNMVTNYIDNSVIGQTYHAVQDIKQGASHVYDKTKQTLGDIKEGIVRGKNAIKGAAVGAFNAGKSAYKFIKNSGGLGGAAKNIASKTAGNVKGRVDKFNSALKRFRDLDKKKAVKDLAVNNLEKLRENLRLAAKKRAEKAKKDFANFVTKYKGLIKIITVGSALAVLFAVISGFVLFGLGISDLVFKQTPHFYCDSEKVPSVVKNSKAFKKYCKIGPSNNGIVEAALSLIDPEYLVGNTQPFSSKGATSYSPLGYGVTDEYREVMDALQDIVQYTDGDEPMPYTNCIGFASTVAAYAGVDENQIPLGNAASNVDNLRSYSEWEEIDWGGDYNNLEPGDFLVGDDGGDGHIYVYIGTEAMLEKFPELGADYILAEAVMSHSHPTNSYGGCASNRQDTWAGLYGTNIYAFRYTGELTPREVN